MWQEANIHGFKVLSHNLPNATLSTEEQLSHICMLVWHNYLWLPVFTGNFQYCHCQNKIAEERSIISTKANEHVNPNITSRIRSCLEICHSKDKNKH